MDKEQEEKIVLQIERFKQEPHPLLPTVGQEERKRMIENIGAFKTLELLQMRENRIHAEQTDPIRYGVEFDSWKDSDKLLSEYNEIIILGGNRAGKTEYAAKRAAQMFVGADLGGMPDWMKERVEKRGLRIWMLHQSHTSSVAFQQNVFYKYLPKELKILKKSVHTQISYSQKNGFTDNTAVYMGNQVWFMNYFQDIKVIEGGEVDFIWCDELVPQDWLDTLRYRLVTRNGKMLVTFTPIQGYTSVVKEYVNSAKITDWKESDLLKGNNVIGVPNGHMPYMARNVFGKHGCIWFHSKDNPYNNWQRMKDTLKGKTSNEVKIRAYGWAEATAGSQFPLFNDHNIFSKDPKEIDGTCYMVADPAGARNWFMLWAKADKNGVLWVYREWPDQSYGEWALPCEKADGKPGPAQRSSAGRGVDEYSLLIETLEINDKEKEQIAERYIDPRSAGTATMTKEGGITLLDMLSDAHVPLYFIPAASASVEERVLVINDLLCYDREKPLEEGVNHPRLMIHENCQNLIYSMREWTGADGQKGASKDPIDALGYLVMMSPCHQDAADEFAKAGQKFAGAY